MTLPPILGLPSPLGVETIQRAADRFRLQVSTGDAQALAAVTRAWNVADAGIAAQQAQYLAKIAAARAAGTPVTEAWLYQVARLDQLRAYVAAQYAQVGVVADRQVKAGQRDQGDTITATQDLIASMVDGPAFTRARVPVSLDFSALDVERQVNGLVGTLQDGSPLRDLTFSNLSVAGAESVARALVIGAVRGDGVRDIAKAMELERNLTKARAQTIARTEILRANRAASQATMRQARDIVDQWRWSSVLSGSCGVCIALQGSLHPVTEDMVSHPNCRCVPLPVTKSWADLGYADIPDTNVDIVSADKYIRGMSAGELRRAFGPARADMIAGGYLKPKDLVAYRDRGRWGSQPGLRSLKETRQVAEANGYTAPRAATPPAPSAVLPPAPPKADVAGLDDLFPRLGGNHPVEAILDRAHAELQRLAMERNDIAARISALSVNDRYTPEGRALQDLRDANSTQLRNVAADAQAALRANRQAALDRLLAAQGTIPDAQARRLLKELADMDTFLKVQRARWPSAASPWDPPADHWKSLVDHAGMSPLLFRRAIAWDLPLRERLIEVKPTDRKGKPGTTTTWGGGQQYQAVHALWNEMADMAAWQERTLGIRTWWDGRIEGYAPRGAAGVANWTGSIGFSGDVWAAKPPYDAAGRRKVALHELFHMASGGGVRMTPGEYATRMGWEEGVVERLAQIYEPEAARAAGKSFDQPAYRTYTEYTVPLERIRGLLGMDEKRFYTSLLNTPVTQRPGLMDTWTQAGMANGSLSTDAAAVIQLDMRKLHMAPRRFRGGSS